jgi:hypothetical protein
MRTKSLFVFAGLICIFTLAAQNTSAQVRRDDLTEKEADIVRDAQQIDVRMAVFVKAIDRRLAALSSTAADPAKTGKQPKDAPDWGELPTGTPAQLYHDIEGILDEAINNIDDVATREPNSKLMFKGVKVLAEGCKRILPQLQSFNEKATDKNEKEALMNAIEYAQSVIDSLGKVPAEEETKDKKKSKN